MMNTRDLERLNFMEGHIRRIAAEFGLATPEVDFEVCKSRKMIEAVAYGLPTNYSHWTFGRDFDRIRTRYEESGAGIPYEAVWNFERPKALLVENNPMGLNILTMAHVMGHVDFHLSNRFLKLGRSFEDIAKEARYARGKFLEYENLYGPDKLERLLGAAESIKWQQHPDVFYEEVGDSEKRSRLIEEERASILAYRRASPGKEVAEKIKAAEERIKKLERQTPPTPVYDLLWYIIENAPELEKWERDVLRVVWNQTRSLAPNARTKMLNEGWATYWHVRIMRRLREEKLLEDKEHDDFKLFHSKVTASSKANFNVYAIGPALYEYVEKMYDLGRFGPEYDRAPAKAKATWDTGAMLGHKKIFEIRNHYSDYMSVLDFFSDEFIHGEELYVYEAHLDTDAKEVVYKIANRDPESIRRMLRGVMATYGQPTTALLDANYKGKGGWRLKHEHYGLDLLPNYTRATLENVQYLWRRSVHLETVVSGKPKLFGFDGNKHSES